MDFIFKPNGELLQEGDVITRPNYANTLELIANNGSSSIFYDPNGPIVQSLVSTIQNGEELPLHRIFLIMR